MMPTDISLRLAFDAEILTDLAAAGALRRRLKA